MGTRRWADITSDSDDSRPGPTELLKIIRANDDSYVGPPEPALDDSKTGMNLVFKTATSVGSKPNCNDAIEEGDEANETEEDSNEKTAEEGDLDENINDNGKGKEKNHAGGKEKKERSSPAREENEGEVNGSVLEANDDALQGAVATSSTMTETSTGSMAEERKPEVNFGSFNATWVPNPSAVEFHPVPLLITPAPPLSTMGPPTKSPNQPNQRNVPNPPRKRVKRSRNTTVTTARVNGLESNNGSNGIDVGDYDAFGRLQSDNVSVIESVSSMKPKKKRNKKNSSASSTDGDHLNEVRQPVELSPEQLKIRLQKREKDITDYKETDFYQKYIKIVPKEERTPTDPGTPVADARMGVREWEFKRELWHREVRHSLNFPPLGSNL